MKKNIKHLGGSDTAKTFTVRLPDTVSQMIRNRANELNMSYSYYVAAIANLEANYKLLEQFGDPLEESATALTADKAMDLIKKLQESGIDVKALLSPDNPQTAPQITAIPPDPEKTLAEQKKTPTPEMPQMRTIQDLIKLNEQQTPGIPNPQIAAAMAGNVGSVSLKLRAAQLKAAQEERAERQMREKILDNLPPEEEKADETKEN